MKISRHEFDAYLAFEEIAAAVRIRNTASALLADAPSRQAKVEWLIKAAIDKHGADETYKVLDWFPRKVNHAGL